MVPNSSPFSAVGNETPCPVTASKPTTASTPTSLTVPKTESTITSSSRSKGGRPIEKTLGGYTGKMREALEFAREEIWFSLTTINAFPDTDTVPLGQYILEGSGDPVDPIKGLEGRGDRRLSEEAAECLFAGLSEAQRDLPKEERLGKSSYTNLL